jgi:hypothetical protein
MRHAAAPGHGGPRASREAPPPRALDHMFSTTYVSRDATSSGKRSRRCLLLHGQPRRVRRVDSGSDCSVLGFASSPQPTETGSQRKPCVVEECGRTLHFRVFRGRTQANFGLLAGTFCESPEPRRPNPAMNRIRRTRYVQALECHHGISQRPLLESPGADLLVDGWWH